MDTPRPRAAGIVSIASLIAVVFVPAAISARTAGARYSVQSIVITFSGSAKAKGVSDLARDTGTLGDVLSGSFTGRAQDAPAGLSTPTLRSQYICSPTCPAFVASGSVTAREMFTSSANGKAVSCATSKKLKNGVSGQVYVTSSSSTTKELFVTVDIAPSINTLFQTAVGTHCALGVYFPIDDSAGLAIPPEPIPASAIGAKTITVSLKTVLKTPTYPWAPTGRTTLRITAILARTN